LEDFIFTLSASLDEEIISTIPFEKESTDIYLIQLLK